MFAFVGGMDIQAETQSSRAIISMSWLHALVCGIAPAGNLLIQSFIHLFILFPLSIYCAGTK